MTESHRTAAAVLCIALVVVAFGASPARAEDAGRTLGGHTFMPSAQVRDPFITTYLLSGTGVSIFQLPLLTIDWEGPEPVIVEGDVLYLVQGFRYQRAVNEWLAVRGAFSATGRGGIDEKSIFAQGVMWSFAGGLGATARVWGAERAALAVSADVVLGNAYTINIFDYVEDIIEDGWDEESSLLSESSTSHGRLGLAGAWAPKRWLGVTASVDWAWTDGSGDRSWDERKLGGSGTVGIDFKELDAVPVGVRVAFSSQPIGQGGTGPADDIRSYGVGVFYTGRPDLSIGADAIFLRLPLIDSDVKTDAMQFSIDMRYYF
ncbi:MAG: hypothetical protein U9Q95_01825 [Candidatus Eisenbacteria bacterium]|nr:hypothetical protein [Candidatus Eisenbacteria bacterium]